MMKEILAENLQSLFDETGINGKCTYKGEMYEVWEVSNNDFEKMCNMTDEEFGNACPDGMWRSSDGCNLKSRPVSNFTVNGKNMIGFDLTEDNALSKSKKYEHLLSYLCDHIGASQPRNVCAIAMDLAKLNEMKMSELLFKYQGF